MNEFENINLVGLDLDGTLLTDDKILPESTIDEIKRLHKKGIYFVPITGRPFGGVPNCIKSLDAVQYIITSNGSQIIDCKSEKSLYSSQLDNDTVREIISVLDGFDCMYEAFFDSYGHMESHTYDYYKRLYSSTPIGDYIFSSRRVVDSISDVFATSNTSADEIFVICKNGEDRNAINTRLSEIPSIQICLLGDRFLEATKKGTDKGSALEWLCEHLGIDIKSTMAFGDGENDIQFLQKAGTAVAMENAFDSVKALADIVTLSNNNDGVGEILKRI